jgi:carbamoylphosphate synthase small subunit
MRAIVPSLTGIALGLQLITSALLFQVIKIGLLHRSSGNALPVVRTIESIALPREAG